MLNAIPVMVTMICIVVVSRNPFDPIRWKSCGATFQLLANLSNLERSGRFGSSLNNSFCLQAINPYPRFGKTAIRGISISQPHYLTALQSALHLWLTILIQWQFQVLPMHFYRKGTLRNTANLFSVFAHLALNLGWKLRRRLALVTTVTEEKPIAAPASNGLSSTPKKATQPRDTTFLPRPFSAGASGADPEGLSFLLLFVRTIDICLKLQWMT